MSTIGLNEGPFLIMTITYENGRFTFADPVENKVPTITLSPVDTIYLAENFPKLRSLTHPIGNSITPINELNSEELDEIVLKARVWGCEYMISLRKVFNIERDRDVVYMEIYNGNFAVKAYFTKDAEQFFQWAFHDIHRSDEYRQLD